MKVVKRSAAVLRTYPGSNPGQSGWGDITSPWSYFCC